MHEYNNNSARYKRSEGSERAGIRILLKAARTAKIETLFHSEKYTID